MKTSRGVRRKRGEMTPHEVAIVDLLRRGYSQPQIAERLEMTAKRVAQAVRRAKDATECATVCQLVAEYAVARAAAKTPPV